MNDEQDKNLKTCVEILTLYTEAYESAKEAGRKELSVQEFVTSMITESLDRRRRARKNTKRGAWEMEWEGEIEEGRRKRATKQWIPIRVKSESQDE